MEEYIIEKYNELNKDIIRIYIILTILAIGNIVSMISSSKSTDNSNQQISAEVQALKQ